MTDERPETTDFERVLRALHDAGPIDLLGEVVGGGVYDALREAAVEVELFGVPCLCVGLRKLIELKRAAGRPRDFEVIAELEQLADQEGEG